MSGITNALQGQKHSCSVENAFALAGRLSLFPVTQGVAAGLLAVAPLGRSSSWVLESFCPFFIVEETTNAVWAEGIVTNTTPLVLHWDKKYRFALFYIK